MATFANREELNAVMDKVVAGLNENETVRNRSKTANVSLGVVVSDLPGAEYVMAFRGGQVTGSPAGADSATVTATMTLETVDRIFSGKLGAESAYFSGALRLRGDEWVAEGLASYIYYMVPIYQAATAT